MLKNIAAAVISLSFLVGAHLCAQSTAGAVVTKEHVHPDGTEIDCDLPQEFHLMNRGGSDGAGLCVFASLKHSAIWQNVEELENIFEYMFTRPGGGYPEKVERIIKQICAEKNVPIPPYIQITNGDLEVLKAACASGRMPAVTYDFSPTGRYGGRRISHMVSLPSAGKHFGVLDNNYPKSIEWLSESEFSKVHGGNRGWSVIFLAEGPPLPPH